MSAAGVALSRQGRSEKVPSCAGVGRFGASHGLGMGRCVRSAAGRLGGQSWVRLPGRHHRVAQVGGVGGGEQLWQP